MEIKKYAYIDALRGIAVLGVLADHSALAVRPCNDTLNWLMLCGAKGVELFFIVSAITLCMSWHARSSHEQFPKLDFYLRRIFRIAPMFYIAMALYLFLFGLSASYAAPYGVTKWFVISTALFLHGWHPETINSIVPGDWTIAAEMMFYGMFPFLVTRFRTTLSLVGFLAVSIILVKISGELFRVVFHYPDNLRYMLSDFSFKNIFGQLPVFILGMIAYRFIQNHEQLNLRIIAGFIGCFILTRAFMPWFTFWGIGFTLLAILLSKYPNRLIVNPVTEYLGKLSFSMYLLQFAFLYFFSYLGLTKILIHTPYGSLIHMLLLTVITTALASASYIFIEKPGINLGKLVIKKANQMLG